MKGSLNLWLIVVLAVAALSFGFGREAWTGRGADRNAPLSEPVPDGPGDPAGAVLSAREEPVHLLVLNGTPQPGLARDFGLLLGQAGCVVERVGNATHDRYETSFLVNRRLTQDRAAGLAARLGDLPVLSEFDTRTTSDAVLVLGRDAERIARRLRSADGR